MDVDLGRLEVGVIVVVPFAGQQQIDTVIHVGANDRGKLLIIIVPGQLLLFVKHVDQTVLVHHGRLFPLLFGQRDRHADEVDVVMLPARVVRAKAPSALFARLRRLRSPLTIRILVNHAPTMAPRCDWRERHPFTEVRLKRGQAILPVSGQTKLPVWCCHPTSPPTCTSDSAQCFPARHAQCCHPTSSPTPSSHRT